MVNVQRSLLGEPARPRADHRAEDGPALPATDRSLLITTALHPPTFVTHTRK